MCVPQWSLWSHRQHAQYAHRHARSETRGAQAHPRQRSPQGRTEAAKSRQRSVGPVAVRPTKAFIRYGVLVNCRSAHDLSLRCCLMLCGQQKGGSVRPAGHEKAKLIDQQYQCTTYFSEGRKTQGSKWYRVVVSGDPQHSISLYLGRQTAVFVFRVPTRNDSLPRQGGNEKGLHSSRRASCSDWAFPHAGIAD